MGVCVCGGCVCVCVCAFAFLSFLRTFIWQPTDTPRTLNLSRTHTRVLRKHWLKMPKTSCFTILGGVSTPRTSNGLQVLLYVLLFCLFWFFVLLKKRETLHWTEIIQKIQDKQSTIYIMYAIFSRQQLPFSICNLFIEIHASGLYINSGMSGLQVAWCQLSSVDRISLLLYVFVLKQCNASIVAWKKAILIKL